MMWMKTFIVGQIRISDAQGYQSYVNEFVPILTQYQGKIVGLSDKLETLEGSWEYPRTVILGFESKAQALRWYRSPEYQRIKKLRERASIANLVVFENDFG